MHVLLENIQFCVAARVTQQVFRKPPHLFFEKKSFWQTKLFRYLENQLVMGFVKVPRHASNKNIILRECAPVPNLYTCVESYVLDAHCLIVL